MSSAAQIHKDRGDTHYKAASYRAAIEDYSQAIAVCSAQAESNLLYICYSNRCACFLQLQRYQEALYDAQQCTALKPDWPKGYLRLGSCHQRLGRTTEAITAYNQVLSMDSGNQEAREALAILSNGSTSHRTPPAAGGTPFNWANLLGSVQTSLTNLYYQAWAYWESISPDTRKYLQLGLVALAVYWIFFRDSGYGYDGYSSGYGGYGGYGGGMSWTTWGLIMFSAYKLPPLFPDQLGQYAQPFFGMSWTTFMWLLNMLSRSGRGGGYGGGYGGYGRRGGMFGRRY